MLNKNILNSKFLIKLLFILLLIFMLFPVIVKASLFGGEPDIVERLNNAFETIEKWLLKLATPAAAVAVAVGFFMQKFSFGDEERIRVAKKLIRSALFSYAFILVLDLVLSAIKTLLQ